MRTIKLGEVSQVSSSKRIFAKQYVQSGIPFYRQKEIIEIENGNEISDPLFISEDLYENIKRDFGVPQKGELLITGVGATLGIPHIIGDEKFYFKDGNLIWCKNFDRDVNSKYVYYWIKSDAGQKAIWSRTIGSAQPALTIDLVKQYEIEVPEIDIQNKIVQILSLYDNLIENNQKQIKLLEETAQRLYKEWFVDLRFPGHENTEILDGIPAGWRIEEVGKLIGKVPRTTQIMTANYHKSGKIPIIDQSKTFIAGYTDDETALVDLGEPVIVFGDHTRILKYIQFPFAKGADGTQLIVSANKNMPQSLLYCGLVNIDLSNYHYARHFKYLKAESLLVPIIDIAKQFDEYAGDLFKRIQVLRDEISSATEARDRLLPKLMSGEIEL